MIDVLVFLRGVAIGLAIAAPVGPVGVLCIRRALADGRTAAFVAGLGAAVADTVFGGVAAYGLTFVSETLALYELPLRGTGGLFLCVLSWRTLTARPPEESCPATGPGLVRDFFATLTLTLTNPATVAGCAAIFAGLGAMGVATGGAEASAAVTVAGVFAGSALWWGVLSAAAGAVRSRFTPRWLRLLNQGSGVMLMVFGLGVWASLVVR